MAQAASSALRSAGHMPLVENGEGPPSLTALPQQFIMRIFSFVNNPPATISRNMLASQQCVPGYVYEAIQEELHKLETAIQKTPGYQRTFSAKQRELFSAQFEDVRNTVMNLYRAANLTKTAQSILPNHFAYTKAVVKTEIQFSLEKIFQQLPDRIRHSLCQQIAPIYGLPSLYCPELKPIVMRVLHNCSRPSGPWSSTFTPQNLIRVMQFQLATNDIKAALTMARLLPNVKERIQTLKTIVEHIDLYMQNTSKLPISTKEYLELLMEIWDENTLYSRKWALKDPDFTNNHYINRLCCQFIAKCTQIAAHEIQLLFALSRKLDMCSTIITQLLHHCPLACSQNSVQLFLYFKLLPRGKAHSLLFSLINSLPLGKDLDFLIPLGQMEYISRNSLFDALLHYYLTSNMPTHALRIYQTAKCIKSKKPAATISAVNTPSKPNLIARLPTALLGEILCFADANGQALSKDISKMQEQVPHLLHSCLENEYEAIAKAINSSEEFTTLLSHDQRKQVELQLNHIKNTIGHHASIDALNSESMPRIKAAILHLILPNLITIFQCFSNEGKENFTQLVDPKKCQPVLHIPHFKPAVVRALKTLPRRNPKENNQGTLDEIQHLIKTKKLTSAKILARTIADPVQRAEALKNIFLKKPPEWSFRVQLSHIFEIFHTCAEEKELENPSIQYLCDLIIADHQHASVEITEILSFVYNNLRGQKWSHQFKLVLGTLFTHCPNACGKHLSLFNSILFRYTGEFADIIIPFLKAIAPKHTISCLTPAIDELGERPLGDDDSEEFFFAENANADQQQNRIRTTMLLCYLEKGAMRQATLLYRKMVQKQQTIAFFGNRTEWHNKNLP